MNEEKSLDSFLSFLSFFWVDLVLRRALLKGGREGGEGEGREDCVVW